MGGRRRRREPNPTGNPRARLSPLSALPRNGSPQLGRTGRLSLEPVWLAASFFGLTRSILCLSGRLSSEPAA